MKKLFDFYSGNVFTSEPGRIIKDLQIFEDHIEIIYTKREEHGKELYTDRNWNPSKGTSYHSGPILTVGYLDYYIIIDNKIVKDDSKSKKIESGNMSW